MSLGYYDELLIQEYEKEGSYQGCFICGSGVNLIVLYPFPTDLKMDFGNKKPSQNEKSISCRR